MPNYTYKCVPIPAVVVTDAKGINQHEAATKDIENIINEEAQQGWEYSTIETITSAKKPSGCLGFLTANKDDALISKMLVFRKEV